MTKKNELKYGDLVYIAHIRPLNGFPALPQNELYRRGKVMQPADNEGFVVLELIPPEPLPSAQYFEERLERYTSEADITLLELAKCT